MNRLRIIAVDDEPIALDRLSDLLASIEDAELIATVKGGREAIEAITRLQPNLVLLDVEMPRIDGFDVVEALLRTQWSGHELVPLICFVTAYPQFAAEAFDTGALDFLCKPVRLARLEKTIGRARAALDQRQAADRLQRLAEQLDELRQMGSPQEESAIWVQHRGELVRLNVGTLDWFGAEGEYVRLHAGDASYLLRTSMTAACSDLEDRGFIRIHRSYAVNRGRVRAIRRTRNGMKVVLDIGVALPVGRKFRKAVDKQLVISSCGSGSGVAAVSSSLHEATS